MVFLGKIFHKYPLIIVGGNILEVSQAPESSVIDTPLAGDSVASRLSRRLLGTPLATPVAPAPRRSPRRLAVELAQNVVTEQIEQNVVTVESQQEEVGAVFYNSGKVKPIRKLVTRRRFVYIGSHMRIELSDYIIMRARDRDAIHAQRRCYNLLFAHPTR